MNKTIDKDEEIARLKKIIHTAHFALLTCKHYSAGKTQLQQFNGEKVRKALAVTEDIAIDSALDDISTILEKQKNKNTSLNNQLH